MPAAKAGGDRETKMKRLFISILMHAIPLVAVAQGTDLSPQVRAFVSVDAPAVALVDVRVIDGTGTEPLENQTLIIRDGVVTAIGDTSEIPLPPDADVVVLSGRTVLPGLVMLHEHMFYPAGTGSYNQQSFSFPRLYLAGGVTTIRTTGAMNPYADLNLKRAIEAGRVPGPRMDVTGPYLNGPGLPILEMRVVQGPEDVRRVVAYWAEEGVDSYKAYMQISRAELAAAVEEAHSHGAKLTGHLCAVTYREAAELGIDNLEHGFMASTDFVPDKTPDECPAQNLVYASLLDLDAESEEFKDLVRVLVLNDVALTSTLPVFETFVPGRPPVSNRALDAMASEARDQYLRQRVRTAVQDDSPWAALFPKLMSMERAFAQAGGLLVTGTDPTGYGGIVAGYANWRAVELLVEAGFSPLEAIKISTLNGARYLGLDDRLGSVAVGKLADLMVVVGNPAQAINAIENVEFVFKGGVGYESKKLFDAVLGTVGIR